MTRTASSVTAGQFDAIEQLERRAQRVGSSVAA